MKKIVIIIILIFAARNVQAQLSSYYNTTLFFRNGTTRVGLMRFSGLSSKIKFKKNKKDKATWYSYKEIDRFIIDDEGKSIEYEYKIVVGNRAPKLMIVKIKGKASLYAIERSAAPLKMPIGGVGNLSFSINVNYGKTSEIYYFSKEGNDVVTKFSKKSKLSYNRFKKIVLKYFGDCKELKGKVKRKPPNFKKIEVEEVVKIYNKCNQSKPKLQ